MNITTAGKLADLLRQGRRHELDSPQTVIVQLSHTNYDVRPGRVLLHRADRDWSDSRWVAVETYSTDYERAWQWLVREDTPIALLTA